MGIKTFRINEKTKKELQRSMIKSKKKYKILLTVKDSFLIIAFCVPVLFLIYAYLVSDSFVQLNDYYAPMGTKNHMFIWMCTATIFVILLFLHIVIKIIYNGLVGKTITERIDENLVLENDILLYGYRLKMQSYVDERIVAKIPMDAVKYYIDKSNMEIIFKGKVFSQFYTNYSQGETNGKGDYIPEIILYDYFEPSLISFLENNKK